MAFSLRPWDLRLINGDSPVGKGFDWWDEIDNSENWQKGIFYFLSSAYALVSLVALVLNMIKIRAILFGLYKNVFLITPKALEIVLLDLPSLLFFSTYTLLVLFWAEIYYQARSLQVDKLRPTYYTINGIVYFTQGLIWLYMGISGSHAAEEIAKIYFSIISLGAALGFVVFGGRLFVMLRRFPIESRGRQKKLYEVALSAFNKNADLDVLDHPILNLFYYTLVEIVPSALVLFILRKLPPKRVSDQYHPIR